MHSIEPHGIDSFIPLVKKMLTTPKRMFGKRTVKSLQVRPGEAYPAERSNMWFIRVIPQKISEKWRRCKWFCSRCVRVATHGYHLVMWRHAALS